MMILLMKKMFIKKWPKEIFDIEDIKNYPQSNKKVGLVFRPYNLEAEEYKQKGQTTHISPKGLEF